MSIHTLLFSFIAVLVLESCQKEFSKEPGGSTPVPQGIPDSIYLDKVVEVWDATDTTLTQFNYDNLKRVASWKEKYSLNALTESDSLVVTYYYTNADSLPYKLIAREDKKWASPVVYDISLDSTFLFWDTQKRLTLDSTLSNYTSTSGSFNRSKYISSIQYLPGKIVYQTVPTTLAVFPGGGFEPPTIDTAWLDGNNNIIRDVSYEVFNSIPTQDLMYTGTYTFDSKPNPYLTLNIFKLFHSNHSITKSWFTPQINNYLTFKSDERGYGSYFFNVQNFYNAKGQLVKAIGIDVTNNSINERYFYYKAL